MTSEALLHWLLRTSIEASLLILIVLGLRMMLGARLTPAWRISLWMLVGMKLILPAFIPAGFGLGSWIRQESAEVSAVIQASSPPEQTSILALSTFSLPDLPVEHAWSFSLQILLVWVWLTGAAAVLLSAFFRQRRFDLYLLTRRTAKAPHLRSILHSLSSLIGIAAPMIRLMPAGTTPAVVGIRQPQILLPEDWRTQFDQRSLRHVLLHELLHVKQHDILWNWAAIAVQAVHWFNPLVWFVVSRFQSDRELRCDAGALELLSPTERLDYGHTLLRIQDTFSAPPAMAGLAPCVRNHPTLRQRILMITTPTTCQPWLHALLVLTLSVLVSYSFTTARAAEKEVPQKVREGSTTTQPSNRSTESPNSDKKTAMRDGEREGGKPSAEREGGTKEPGMRDGEGARKPGTRDGEGGEKNPGTGDGDKPRRAMRDGENPRTGERDGEKPRNGERDGMKKTGERDGGGRPSAESGSKPRKGEGDSASTGSSSDVITMHLTANGDTILINGEKRPMRGLRGYLQTFLPEHPGAKVIVSGDPDTPLKSLHQILDAVRDNGNKNVGIKAE
jgi:beta-lactamase regulating signal transducer with metallopeptidase domain/biopolymer transport protein ExbD